MEAIEAGKKYAAKDANMMKLSGNVIPAVAKDNTDRNRTSPFAFTGNKFEFRMLGSQASIACTNIYLNTIVAEELDEIAAKLEGAKDLDKAVKEYRQEDLPRT
jgi:glutamine synthetase